MTSDSLIPASALSRIDEKLDHISRQLDRVVYRDIYDEQRERMREDIQQIREELEDEKQLRGRIAFAAFSAISALGLAVLNNAVSLFT